MGAHTWVALADGFRVALTPAHLAWSLLGVSLGTAVGVLPGIGPALTVSLLLPVTFGVEPDVGVHHVRRHLLRSDVRRVHHVHSA